MQTLENIVDFYLKTDTNYALMITGEWGTGKTYYFKNKLKKNISETPTFQDNSKKYKPILISLFGLKSIEDIQKEIFFNLHLFLKNSKVKIGIELAKTIAKGVLHLSGFGEYEKFIKEINVETGEFLNTEELVICFDDLERISKNLSIEEFIGYVNSLVENDNIKVLIIANEDKIDNENYSVLKEKVIGNTIEFIIDIDSSYDSIIIDKYGGFPSYKDFLEQNKDFILSVFSKGSSNLRILIFALNYFHTIHSEVNKNLFEEDNLKKYKDEIISNLLKFTIAISIEYKTGKISYKNRNDVDNVHISLMSIDTLLGNNISRTENDEDKTYKETFKSTYYEGEICNFYESVYNYVTGGKILEYEDLLLDLKRLYHIEENNIMPQYETLNILSHQNCFKLSNEDYLKETKKMLYYAFKGMYNISDYTSIFYYALRFNNPLNCNIDRLEKQIIKGMTLGKRNYDYYPSLDFYIDISSDVQNGEHLKRIRDAAISINNDVLSDLKTEEANELESLCYSKFNEFVTKALEKQYEPFFSKFNSDKFYSFFYNSSPEQKWEIVKFFNMRYRYNISELKEEIPFLKRLKTRVERKNAVLSGKNISGYIYSEFLKKLELITQNDNS